ncbi:MAG: iron-sulfur cluster assembly accessory protein [Candidatus Thalassarchaeum sp.]|nr:iron-sulfur cluster assembly accessory protein [Candidatus Thalassarchaeum sp.]
MLTITDLAKEKLAGFAAQAEDSDTLVLRVAIVGRGANGFQYDLQLISQKDAPEDDVVVEIDGVIVSVAEKSAVHMDGATLDFKESLMGGGFHFENPNPLWADPTEQAVAEIIESKVNPAVASHGGTVSLVGVDDGQAVISFGGGCQGCGMADVTLKQGIVVMLMDEVEGITGVVDITDHAAGTNPFY